MTFGYSIISTLRDLKYFASTHMIRKRKYVQATGVGDDDRVRTGRCDSLDDCSPVPVDQKRWPIVAYGMTNIGSASVQNIKKVMSIGMFTFSGPSFQEDEADIGWSWEDDRAVACVRSSVGCSWFRRLTIHQRW